MPPPGSNLSQVNSNLLAPGGQAFGRFEVTFNTGQGRAVGDPTAVIERLNLVDDTFPLGDSRNNVDTLLNPERRLGLAAYTSQTIAVNAPMSNLGFSGPLNARTFANYPLDISRLEIEQASGPPFVLTGAGGGSVVLEDFPSNIVTLAGRTTSLQIFLDDAMLNVVDNGNGLEPSFDRARFESVNLADDGSGTFKLLAHLADYIVFDITNVPNKPTMSNSVPATQVWFNGDAIALSGDSPGLNAPPESMEVLTPLSPPIEGLFSKTQVANNVISTYTLRQVDPRDLSNLARITALQGTWRDYFNPTNPSASPFLNLGSFEAITFPQTLEQQKHDMVVFSRNGAGEITNFYFGEVNFATNTFSIWPIDQVDDGAAANEVSGSVSALLDSNGSPTTNNKAVRSGTFTITSGGVPANFNSSGRFIVYRL